MILKKQYILYDVRKILLLFKKKKNRKMHTKL